MKELRATASKHLLPGWEVPAGILLESEPFSPENGLLTSTMKASRPRLEIKYRSALEELYAKFEGKRSVGFRQVIFISGQPLKVHWKMIFLQ